jgi:hypothetical protein
METLIMDIIYKESEALNLTFTVTERGVGRKQVNWRYEDKILNSEQFMDSYRHIKEKLSSHPKYDGWDLGCQHIDGKMQFLNEGSFFFNGDDLEEGYSLIIDLVSQD